MKAATPDLLEGIGGWVPVALAGAAWLAARIHRLTKNAPPRPVPAAESERTRQVREELQRRIAARRMGAPPPAASRPPPRTAAPKPEKPEAPDPLTAPVREEERKLTEEVRTMQAIEAKPRPPPATAFPPPSAGVPAASSWLAELRETDAARRAILLREILGPPVGQRGWSGRV